MYICSIVNEVIRTISNLFIFFLQKDFERAKTRKSQLTKQKQVNSKQQRQQVFRAKKLLRGGKSFVLRFGSSFTLKVFS